MVRWGEKYREISSNKKRKKVGKEKLEETIVIRPEDAR